MSDNNIPHITAYNLFLFINLLTIIILSFVHQAGFRRRGVISKFIPLTNVSIKIIVIVTNKSYKTLEINVRHKPKIIDVEQWQLTRNVFAYYLLNCYWKTSIFCIVTLSTKLTIHYTKHRQTSCFIWCHILLFFTKLFIPFN